MKLTLQRTIAVIAILFVSAAQSFAVVGQALQVYGTNLVLFWPSQSPYQQYYIEYRQTLDPTTPWAQLVNAYPASATNLTTYTVYGAVPLAQITSGGGSGSGDSPPSPTFATSLAVDTQPTEILATPANGTGAIVPLALYPPGFDLSSFLIYDPAMSNWISGADYTPAPLAAETLSFTQPLDGPGGTDGPSPADGDPPNTGFYRVWHIPNWPFNVTNYAYDGPTFFPVDFADYMDRVDSIAVLLNGQPTPYAEFMPYIFSNGQTNWGMGIYLNRVPSGTYQIQLISTLRLGDDIGEATTYMTLSNSPATILVDNQVTFTNWDDLIWNTNYTFNSQTKTLNTDWYIDIWDAWGDYVNGGSGHTSNGQIAWTWDLTDLNGNPRDSLDSDPWFDTEITFTANAQQTTRYTPLAMLPYPDTGSWLVSYQDTFYTGTAGQQYVQGINSVAGGPAFRGIPNSVFPIKFGTNGYTQDDRNNSYANLKARLYQPETRNFYYFGHANATAIGCDVHTYNTNGQVTGGKLLPGSKAFITSMTISNELTFNKHSGARPYRFVFLDGCHTADGQLPDAFGVNKAENDYGYYTNSVSNPSHRRPSAFMGWITEPGGPGWGTVETQWYFRTQWMQDWSYWWQTDTLAQAIDYALNTSTWPPGGYGQLWGGFKIYGYQNLRLDQYNHKADWPGPP